MQRGILTLALDPKAQKFTIIVGFKTQTIEIGKAGT